VAPCRRGRRGGEPAGAGGARAARGTSAAAHRAHNRGGRRAPGVQHRARRGPNRLPGVLPTRPRRARPLKRPPRAAAGWGARDLRACAALRGGMRGWTCEGRVQPGGPGRRGLGALGVGAGLGERRGVRGVGRARLWACERRDGAWNIRVCQPGQWRALRSGSGRRGGCADGRRLEGRRHLAAAPAAVPSPALPHPLASPRPRQPLAPPSPLAPKHDRVYQESEGSARGRGGRPNQRLSSARGRAGGRQRSRRCRRARGRGWAG
jgi:hypothetical protein